MFLLEKRMLSDASGLLGAVSALPQDDSLNNVSGNFEHTSNSASAVHAVTPDLLVAAPNAVIFIESNVTGVVMSFSDPTKAVLEKLCILSIKLLPLKNR